MRLPQELRQAVADETATVGSGDLAGAVAELSREYRAANFGISVLNSPSRRAAYLQTRLPATYAANAAVFSEIRRLAPALPIESMLDLGAGPGTSMWAAAQTFHQLRNITNLERDQHLIVVGGRLAQHAPQAAVRNSEWRNGNMADVAAFEPLDLVVLSYALGELPEAQQQTLIARALGLTAQLLVIIEPGTPRGFGNVESARRWLIKAGAHLLAPCPHELACPLVAAGDWCHFAVRVERTSEHRRLKGGELSYEDEKFSYVVATKVQLPKAEARIVRRPMKHSGHVQMQLCTPAGLQKTTVAKSQKELYRAARKTSWGDEWPPNSRESDSGATEGS